METIKQEIERLEFYIIELTRDNHNINTDVKAMITISQIKTLITKLEEALRIYKIYDIK